MTDQPELPPPTPDPPQPPAAPGPPQPGTWPPGPHPGQPQPWQGWPQQGWVQSPPPPPPAGTNKLAIAALVASILGTLCFSSFVLAIVALVQTGRTRQKGKGLAIAALVISCLWMVGAFTAGVIAAVQEDQASHDTAAATEDSEDVSTFDIVVGDCLITAQLGDEEDSIRSLPKVPCSKRHDAEVYSIVETGRSTYPGDDAMADLADELCGKEFDKVLPRNVVRSNDYSYLYLFPSSETWEQDDRDVTCMVTTDDLRTGSLRD